jgi:hypothetical protein
MYRVILTEVNGAEDFKIIYEGTIGECIDHAWQLVNRHGFPASVVDILHRNDAGLWVSVWDYSPPEMS